MKPYAFLLPSGGGPTSNQPQKGFTLLEIMMVVVGVLASLSLPAYQSYVERAQFVQVTSFVGEIRTALQLDAADGSQFPSQLLGSQSRVAARQTGGARVPRRNSRIRSASELIDEYYYDYNPNRDWAYVAIRLNKDKVRECRGRCILHVGAKRVGDQVRVVCGRWRQAHWPDPFPPAVLPRECQSRCVVCELRQMR